MPENTKDSILTTTKSLVNIPEENEEFDNDILALINSVFSTLEQVGVGPKDGFRIDDKSQIWEQFTVGDLSLNSVRAYMGIRVRILFDPPTNSSVLKAFQDQAAEFEWRLGIASEKETTSAPAL